MGRRVAAVGGGLSLPLQASRRSRGVGRQALQPGWRHQSLKRRPRRGRSWGSGKFLRRGFQKPRLKAESCWVSGVLDPRAGRQGLNYRDAAAAAAARLCRSCRCALAGGERGRSCCRPPAAAAAAAALAAMSGAGGGGGGGGEAQIQRASPGSPGRESGFAFVRLHHNPGLGGRSLAKPRGKPGGGRRRRPQEPAREDGRKESMLASQADQGRAPPAASWPAPRGRPPPCRARRREAPLLRWDEVPDDFVECFILSGYRRLHCTAQDCLASVLQPTNETLNFWTHFIPLLLFAGRFCRLLLLRGAGDLPFHHPLLLPLWCYASGVLLTFAMSCTAHVFSCLSLRLRAAFFYLDYASISYYGFASTVAYYHYLLPGLSLLEPRALGGYLQQRLGWHVDCGAPIALYSALVLPVAFALAVACTVACCKSRTDWCAYPFAIRTFVFAMPLSMACPIMLESFLFDLKAHNPTLFVYFYRRYFWLLVAAFFNVSKLPERIQPGLFDIIGHSHQLFHIFTFLSIYDQMFYVEEGLQHFLQAPPPAVVPTFLGTFGYMLLLILCLGLVIRRFLNVPELSKND